MTLLGILATIAVAGGSFWLNYVAAQVDDLRNDQKEGALDRSNIKQRQAVVETKLDMVIETTKATNDEVRALRQAIERRSLLNPNGHIDP